MKYTSFIFDMDGTLADTSPGVFVGIRLVLDQMGEPQVRDDQLPGFIGPPLRISFHEICGMDEKRAMEAGDRFTEYYEEGVYNCRLYDGMVELIKTLHSRGCKLMIATLKREGQAQSLAERLGIAKYFSAIVGSDDAELRTKKDTIEIALEQSGITDTAGVLMIGDSAFDAIGAEQAGVDFCAALYGFGLTPEKADEHPCAVRINAPLELLEKI